MALIYIDTNVFLDFYQSATDRLSIFKEIEKYSEKVIITKQTEDEFLRNRVARLETLSKEVSKSVSGGIFTTALIREMKEFSEIDKFQKEIKRLANEITTSLNSWKNSDDVDPVMAEFSNIIKKSKFFQHTDRALELAKNRKILGNPPTSPDKHTVGDELIWETLLEHSKDDLIIVSRDHTFMTNVSILKNEYQRVTGKSLITVTKNLSEALRIIGENSPRLAEADKEVEMNVEFDARTLEDKCPKCGGALEEMGYDGSDGDSAWWLDCISCGATFFPKK